MSEYYIDRPELKRIEGGGRYASQWFDVRTALTFEEYAGMAKLSSQRDDSTSLLRGVMTIAGSMVVAWSIRQSNQEPVPVSVDTFMGLPFEMIKPVIDYVNSPDFLAQLSADQSPEK